MFVEAFEKKKSFPERVFTAVSSIPPIENLAPVNK
jgi:hypothetical protein